jgi:hypothetical protein
MCKKMFVLAMVVFLLTALFNYGFAQDKAVTFGIRLGTNSTFTNGDLSGIDIKPRFVLNAGAFAEYWLSKAFAFQGGVLYNKKGEKWGKSSAGNLVWSFNYLTIPLYGKAAFGDRTRFCLLFGLEPGFLLSAKQKLEVKEGAFFRAPPKPRIDGPTTIEEDWKENLNSFEFALGAGMGVEIPLNQSLKLFFAIRGSLGLTDIFKELPGSDVIEFAEYQGVKDYIASVDMGVIF